MKRVIPVVLIVSFVGIVVLGFTLFGHEKSHPNVNCVATQIDGSPCPTSLISFVIHHASALQIFSTTLVSPLLLLLATIALVFWPSQKLLSPNPKFLYRKSIDFSSVLHKARQKFISWLSLLELSPSF